jgi:hypothetical protein
MYRILLLLLTILVLCSLTAASANADGPAIRSSELPSSLRYLGSGAAESHASALDYKHRSEQFRAVTVTTRYRTKSILRYSRALGKTGMILRVKAPMKPRKIIKLELRF